MKDTMKYKRLCQANQAIFVKVSKCSVQLFKLLTPKACKYLLQMKLSLKQELIILTFSSHTCIKVHIKMARRVRCHFLLQALVMVGGKTTINTEPKGFLHEKWCEQEKILKLIMRFRQ